MNEFEGRGMPVAGAATGVFAMFASADGSAFNGVEVRADGEGLS